MSSSKQKKKSSGKNQTYALAEFLESQEHKERERFITALKKHFYAILEQKCESGEEKTFACPLCLKEHKTDACLYIAPGEHGRSNSNKITVDETKVTTYLSKRQFKVVAWAKSRNFEWFTFQSEKIDFRSIPWLWIYGSSEMKDMTVSHTHNEKCVKPEHLSQLALRDNQGLNDCAPCVCHHAVLCKTAGHTFRDAKSQYSQEAIENIRFRLGWNFSERECKRSKRSQ